MLPPRLRHANDVGALRPLNFRTVSAGRGRRTTLLRILMTNACSFNCHYCPMRRDRNMPRALLKPHELVHIFLEARRRGWCEGLFITTGIPGRPTKVMDDLIAVLELLRNTHQFAGYIHVKILPGAEAGAGRADHGARDARLGQSRGAVRRHAHRDRAGEELRRRRSRRSRTRERSSCASSSSSATDAAAIRSQPGGASGMTTQFVVGATPDTDRTIVNRVSELYRGGGVHHVHFSAFRPIRDTPLETRAAVPALREHRLYQTDYLLRYYGFTRERRGLRRATATCRSIAIRRSRGRSRIREHFPLDVMTASYESLVRVPGIGVVTARRIVNERRTTIIRDLSDLKRLGVQTTRATGFLSLRGRALERHRWTEQLGFWQAGDEVGRITASTT